MGWSLYADDQEVQEVNEEVITQRETDIAHRMADLAKQMSLYSSEDFSFFLTYLENFQERVKNEAITVEDPTKHAEKRAEYRLLAHLRSLPHRAQLEYRALQDEMETLRPEHAGTLG